MKYVCLFLMAISFQSVAASQYSLGHLPLTTKTTWKQIRDNDISKQDIDYSCGASSLSTILTYFYKTPKTEQEILNDMNLKEVMASFLDLAEVSKRYGFYGKGIFTDYNSLSKIKIPVIVYVNHKRSDHFSVVRAIDDKNVYLSDSSWGNRVLSKKQFEKIWLTHNNNTQGKALLILPTKEEQKQMANNDFVKIKQTQNLLLQVPHLFQRFY